MDGSMLDGLDSLMKFLGMWKLVELIIWAFRHISI